MPSEPVDCKTGHMTSDDEDRSGLPRRFRAGLQQGGFHGAGHVVVDRDALVAVPTSVDAALRRHLLPDASSPEIIEHVGSKVVVIMGRIPAPVVNTVLLIQSQRQTVAASFPPWTRRPLLAALRQAGFDVHVERRLVAVGEAHVSPWP